MHEVPLLELIFYARKSSHIYIFVLVLSIVLLVLNKNVNPVLYALYISDLVMMTINIIVLRVVIANPSQWNTFIALVLVVFLELFYTFTTL